jgi:zinc/manganese transport system substrate-binding protein
VHPPHAAGALRPSRPAAHPFAAARFTAAVGGLLALLVLAGCGSSTAGGTTGSTSGNPTGSTSSAGGAAPTSTAGTSTSGSRIAVVASTNVWGDVASIVGGTLVQVESFISDPAQDPHSFEANPRDQLVLSKAALVIENGGGYDDFVDTMLAASGSKAPLINAVTVSGKGAAAGGDLNEHVWYDFPTVGAVAADIAAKLSAIDPSGAPTFTANLAAFQQQLNGLTSAVAAVKSRHAGEPVAITEPVPLYLLDAAGLVNQTPQAFSKAIEEGSDVPARTMADMLGLFTGKKVKLLAYNEQTSGPETQQVLKSAQANAIPTVPVTETMPPGDSYVSWMQSNVDAIGKALGG